MGRNYPRAPPDRRRDRSTTQDCSVTVANGVSRFFVGWEANVWSTCGPDIRLHGARSVAARRLRLFLVGDLSQESGFLSFQAAHR
jgi:hypothetical protein